MAAHIEPLPLFPEGLWGAITDRMSTRALAQFSTTCKAAKALVDARVQADIPATPAAERLAKLREWSQACHAALGSTLTLLLECLGRWWPGVDAFDELLDDFDDRLPDSWQPDSPQAGPYRLSPGHDPANACYFSTTLRITDRRPSWQDLRLDVLVSNRSPFLTAIQMYPSPHPGPWQAGVQLKDRGSCKHRRRYLLRSLPHVPHERDIALLALIDTAILLDRRPDRWGGRP